MLKINTIGPQTKSSHFTSKINYPSPYRFLVSLPLAVAGDKLSPVGGPVDEPDSID